MAQVKMGGKERTRIFLKGNDDVADSLLSLSEGGRKLDRGFRDLVREKYNGAFDVELIHEPCGRSDLLLQQLQRDSVPEDLAEKALDDSFMTTQFRSRLFQAGNEIDVVAFSLQPEIVHPLWKHRQKGYLLYPPPHWEESWSPPRKKWFQEQFSSIGLLHVTQFKENLGRLVREVKQRLGAHVIVYGCSSIDPDDHVRNYHGLEDTLALRVHKFNLALMQLSMSEGISIVDVDRTIAQIGGAQHVNKVLDYSATAAEAIGQEFFRVLEDIGFFERRPLVMQVGRRTN